MPDGIPRFCFSHGENQRGMSIFVARVVAVRKIS